MTKKPDSDTRSRTRKVGDGTKRHPQIVMLPLTKLHSSPYQPRQHFDPEEINSLVRSIIHDGLLAPILAQHDHEQGGYIILAGQRRVEAYRQLEHDTIPAVVLDRDANPAAIPMIENLLRVDLTPFERAKGVFRLMKKEGYTQEMVADRLGQSQESVSQLLSLRRLSQEVRQKLRTCRGPALSLLVELATCDEAVQAKLWHQMESGEIRTVKELRAAKKAQQHSAQDKAQPRQSTKIPAKLLGKIHAAIKQLRNCAESKTVIKLLKELEQHLHKA